MSGRYGGLMELVARGKKDIFFTNNPTVSFFHSVYIRAAPFTKEIYVSKPRNIPEWGRWVDFDIDHRGDIVKHVYLRIELPSWLPNAAIEANNTGIVTDASGVTFGWCNNIGFQLIKSVQIFQDQVLIHETYGEYLDWRLRQSYGMATAYVLSSEVGSRAETALAIGRSASPQFLRVPIPLFGWQHLGEPGLPTIALRNQRFRMRIYLRQLNELIVASDGRLQPSPWDKTLHIQRTAGGPIDTSLVTLPALKHLGMSLETTQLYIAADVQTWLKAQTIRFPFVNIQSEQYTIEDSQMTAAFMGGTFTIPFALDLSGPVERILIGFRTEANNLAGDRTNLLSPTQQRLVNTLRLNISNNDRIKQFPVAVFREVAAYWKSKKPALDLINPKHIQEVYTLSFGGRDDGKPAGTLNFTRASLPVLFATLNAISYDRRNVSRKTFCILYAESWRIWEIAGGKGKIMFDE